MSADGLQGGQAPGSAPSKGSGEPDAAVVVIGRNEGERLRAALRAARRSCARIVYVDSGSTDGSVALAASEGAVVHELSADRPFSAARGRNEGFEIARKRWGVPFVQFVDGDSLLDADWLATGTRFLRDNPKVGMLCGDNVEEFPDASVYNRLCEVEWTGPAGEVPSCGGNAMVRAEAFGGVGGYDGAVRAGEEPELSVRLRQAGYSVHRLKAPMTLHDADLHRFGEWWRRMERAGLSYWQVYQRHGDGPEAYHRTEIVRAVLWGGVLPGLALLALLVFPPAAIIIAALYAAKLGRVAWRNRDAVRRPLEYAAFMLIGNVAEFIGIARAVATAPRPKG